MRSLLHKKLWLFFLLGSVVAIVLTYFEFGDVVLQVGLDSLDLQVIIIPLLYQTIIFSIIFLSVALIRNHLIHIRNEERNLEKIEKIGLLFEAVSIIPSIITVYGLCSLTIVSILSIFFICLGIKLYCKMKSELSISFMLWGIALYVLLHLCTLANNYLALLIP